MAHTANQTTLRNISGVTKYFDFIGEHGKTLTAGEDVDVNGNVWESWRYDTIRTAALLYALNNNLIEIIRTPIVLGFDPTLTAVRKLGFDNGDPTSEVPDYGSYTGSAP